MQGPSDWVKSFNNRVSSSPGSSKTLAKSAKVSHAWSSEGGVYPVQKAFLPSAPRSELLTPQPVLNQANQVNPCPRKGQQLPVRPSPR